MLCAERAMQIGPRHILVTTKSRNLVMLALNEFWKTKKGLCQLQVLAPWCASKFIDIMVPHPLVCSQTQQEPLLLVSLVSAFCVQVIEFNVKTE